MSLVVDHISKSFGPVRALDGVSFSVEPGRIFGLLGANGAGKTSCMRIVLDILRADSGSVTWQGRANTDLARRTWGYLPEERGLYLRMKVIDVLRFFAALYGVPEAQATAEVEDWLKRFRVPEYRDRRVEELSKGNQQKIQFIAAILHDPQVLIMDEPFSGLDPVNVQLLKEAFLEMHVATGTDPESILQAALARGERVTRFEIADPSLEEIFIERVGNREIEEERHLASGRQEREASVPAGKETQ